MSDAERLTSQRILDSWAKIMAMREGRDDYRESRFCRKNQSRRKERGRGGPDRLSFLIRAARRGGEGTGGKGEGEEGHDDLILSWQLYRPLLLFGNRRDRQTKWHRICLVGVNERT